MECLHSFANTECFTILQDKVNSWRLDFNNHCIESNIGRCSEILELNAKIQVQLFKLLGLCAIQGDFKGSESTIRKRMLPYFGEEYLSNGLTSGNVVNILQSIGQQTKQFPSKPLRENKQKIRQKKDSKERSKPQEMSDRLDKLKTMISELALDKNMIPNKQRKKKIRLMTRSQSNPILSDQIEGTKNEEKREQSDGHGDFHGNDIEEIRRDTYLQAVVGDYNDLFSELRVHAMDILKHHIDDHENNQRIMFALIMTAAKQTSEMQRTLRKPFVLQSDNTQKLQFRKPISHSILKGLRARIIYELLNNRGPHYQFHLSPKFQFFEMENFIDKTIELFWKFGGVSSGLQLSEAADGELFDEHKYRRSYDSDCGAPLVNHHIWPCLTKTRTVLVKGEACTRASNKMSNRRNISTINNSSSQRHPLK